MTSADEIRIEIKKAENEIECILSNLCLKTGCKVKEMKYDATKMKTRCQILLSL